MSKNSSKIDSFGLRAALFFTRVVTGASMIGLGLRLFVGGGWGAWNSIGVVLPTTYPRGPIGDIFLSFWGNEFVIQLLIWGSVAVGLSLVFGAFLRLGAYGGILIMLMLYLAVIPPASVIFNQHTVYIMVLAILAISKAGEIGGIDSFIGEPLEESYPKLKYFLG